MKMIKYSLVILLFTCSVVQAGDWSTDSFGNTTGRVGDRRFSCYTDSFGNTSCR